MELALSINNCVSSIIVLGFTVFFVWEQKAKKSIFIKLIKMTFAAMLFGVGISRLVLEVFLGEEYMFTIFILISFTCRSINNI